MHEKCNWIFDTVLRPYFRPFRKGMDSLYCHLSIVNGMFKIIHPDTSIPTTHL
jgi:hypothetical protein